MNSLKKEPRVRFLLPPAAMLCAALAMAACAADTAAVPAEWTAAAGEPAAAPIKPAADALQSAPSLADTWGIEITGIRVSAAGYMLDFRYRILDPHKALPLVDREIHPLLIDQATGARMASPTPPKVGQLRQTVRHGLPKPGRVYYILFANPGRYIQPGAKVTVVIGDFHVEDLIVG